MNLQVIDNHTVDVSRLSGGAVLDAGARGFRFAKHFAEFGHKVYAFDPAPDIENPRIKNVNFYRIGIIGDDTRRNWHLANAEDKEAAFLKEGPADKYVPTSDLEGIMSFCRIDHFDVIKLNVEGAEYDILRTLKRPIANQIVVSFHEHTGRGIGREGCDKIVEQLGKWYEAVQHVWEPRYCSHPNYWDTLLVLKPQSKYPLFNSAERTPLTSTTVTQTLTNTATSSSIAPPALTPGPVMPIPTSVPIKPLEVS